MYKTSYVVELIVKLPLTLCFVSIFCVCCGNSKPDSLYITRNFSPKDIVVNHIAFDAKLGFVYVGAQNRLYQLDRDFNVIANVTTGPIPDHHNCIPQADSTKPCPEKEWTNNTNKLLLIDKNQSRLIACGSVVQGICNTTSLRNISNITNTSPDDMDIHDIISSNVKGGSTIGVITQGPTVNNSVLYVAASLPEASDKYFYSHGKLIITRSLGYDPTKENTIFKYAIIAQGTSSGSSLKNIDQRGHMRENKYVFETGDADGFVYFVFSRTSNANKKYQWIVARICKTDPLYFSYLELPISCFDSESENALRGAYFFPGANGSTGTLYVFSNWADGSSGVCSFTKEFLDKQFYKMVDLCFKHQGKESHKGLSDSRDVVGIDEEDACVSPGEKDSYINESKSLYSYGSSVPPRYIGRLPYYPEYKPPPVKLLCGAFYLPTLLIAKWTAPGNDTFSKRNTEFTALTIQKKKDIVIAFIGTAHGDVLQVNFNRGSQYNSVSLGHQILPDFVWDYGEKSSSSKDSSQIVPHLFVPTSKAVIRMRIAACEKFTTCGDCIRSDDPYCGWCILEGRCSTLNECKTAAYDSQRWLAPDSNHCLSIRSLPPVDASYGSGELEITVFPRMGNYDRPLIYAYEVMPYCDGRLRGPTTLRTRYPVKCVVHVCNKRTCVKPGSCEHRFLILWYHFTRELNIGLSSAKLTLDLCTTSSVDLLPSLDVKQTYHCVYNNMISYKADLITGSKAARTVKCARPAGSELPPTPNGADSQNVSLSLRFNEEVDVVNTTIIYYDCAVYGEHMSVRKPCAGCLSNQWPCRWCMQDGKCVSASRQECINSTELCPTVLSVKDEDRLISVGTETSIRLNTLNIPDENYPKCVVEFSPSQKTEVSAVYDNGTVTCQNHVYNYSQNEQVLDAFVTLHWKLSYVVDSDSDRSNVTFYKCEIDREDCSRCVAADPKYKCGWCSTERKCSIGELCGLSASSWWTNGDSCPSLTIESIYPTSGPTVGGTLLHIYGANMGTRIEEVESVTVGGKACVLQHDLYQVSVRIVCKTTEAARNGSVEVAVTVRGVTKVAPSKFEFRNPTLKQIYPRNIPMAGGTEMTINGENLQTGYKQHVVIRKSTCKIIGEVQPDTIRCISPPFTFESYNFDVFVDFDDLRLTLHNSLSYIANPEITQVSTNSDEMSSFLVGGRRITVEATRFEGILSPMMKVVLLKPGKRARREIFQKSPRLPDDDFNKEFKTPCTINDRTTMTCLTPLISRELEVQKVVGNDSDSLKWEAKVTFALDGVIIEHDERLVYYPNPYFVKWTEPVVKIKGQLLEIEAYNLKRAITKSEVEVMLGEHKCLVQPIEEGSLQCTVPAIPDLTEDTDFTVSVRISKFIDPYEIGTLTYDVESPPISKEAIIVIIVVGVLLVAFIIAIGVYCFRKNRRYKANKNNFQIAMDNMEKAVRADFRKAFAELNVDMTDLTADIGDYGIPCLDYRTYVTNLFFPSYRYHPCTNQPNPQATALHDSGLSQFLILLSNRSFLTAFIHVLEEQKCFSNRDKGNVASLLTVALHHKLDYFTEVMKCLIKDLVSVSVQRNPKLILRRSDSVAERMLSNWMYICLYPYLRDKAGSPIFLLLKAIKQQVSKGAVDAITGKARYTLSDDRLLQDDVESHMLTLFIAPNSNTDDEPIIVKVLSCDSVAQVKEKVMDAVYKRMPFSDRPKADQLDIEWRHGRGGHLVLPNVDYTSEINSRWRRLMTISDYKVNDNATLALIPKQHEHEGSQDLSTSASNQQLDVSPLSPMLPDERDYRTYHLVKSTDDVDGKRESTINRDRKHIPEIYLLRLINMKGILQKYVEDVLHAILDKSDVPGPVKHFFHFLDELAAEHGITDPEVLHIWKTNSLLGRFWVTILKNPDSVFDIEKPDTIASSMAVISQTFIDACSVTEHKPTKDSPINKQLYAKEIPTYKKLVQDYYKVIKEQPPISDQDVSAYMANISRMHGCEFDVNVALKELIGYFNKYYEEVSEALENDPSIPPHILQKLHQTYNLIDSA